MTETVLEVIFGARTETGLVRPHNEDSYLTVPPVFLVADGMGGHSSGEVASRSVADAFLSLAGNQWLTSESLINAVAKASSAVKLLADEGRHPGSTLTGVGLTKQSGMACWLVFNIGDSRTYLLRDGQLLQISVDHSATRQRPDGPAVQHVITRALGAGMRSEPAADQWIVPAREGDRILLCSDGLTNELTSQLVSAILMAATDPRDAATQLVDAAINAGGHDNVTAVVVFATKVVSTISSLTLGESTESDDDTIPDEEPLEALQ